MLSLLEAKQIAGNAYIALKGKEVVADLVKNKMLGISYRSDERHLYTIWQYGNRNFQKSDVISIQENLDDDYVEIQVDLQTGTTKIKTI